MLANNFSPKHVALFILHIVCVDGLQRLFVKLSLLISCVYVCITPHYASPNTASRNGGLLDTTALTVSRRSIQFWTWSVGRTANTSSWRDLLFVLVLGLRWLVLEMLKEFCSENWRRQFEKPSLIWEGGILIIKRPWRDNEAALEG